MKELPADLADFAAIAIGDIGEVTDRSWARQSSAVWEVTGTGRGRWFIKRHSSVRFHQREVSAYRRWTAALGPGRALVLAAADTQLLAIVVSGIPGQIVRDLAMAAQDEREVHRQAGLLLRLLHDAAPPVAAGPGTCRAVNRVEEHLHRAAGLLSGPETALVRWSAADLPRLATDLPAVPTHGDAQPRNWLWDQPESRLAVIDFERAEPGHAVRDVVRLEYGPWNQRPDLRQAFFCGYGRALTAREEETLRCLAAIDALSGLQWGTANHDHEVTTRARRTLDRLLAGR